MKYLSANEISKIWGISARRVAQLARLGRIEGAVNNGRKWKKRGYAYEDWLYWAFEVVLFVIPMCTLGIYKISKVGKEQLPE